MLYNIKVGSGVTPFDVPPGAYESNAVGFYVPISTCNTPGCTNRMQTIINGVSQ